MKTFAAWLDQSTPNAAVPVHAEDVLEAIDCGLERVVAALNGMPEEVRRLPDKVLGRALKERGLIHAVAIGLEVPFAGLPLRDRLDAGFHPSRFRVRSVEGFTRLEMSLTVDFLNAVFAGLRVPAGIEPTTEAIKACLSAWMTRYVFHTLSHQRQEITVVNYQDHSGISRLHADFEADLESIVDVIHAFGLPLSVEGVSPNAEVLRLVQRLACCSAFGIRQSMRGPTTVDEERDRWMRSTAGRISSRLVVENLVPTSVIVGVATPRGVPVIINNHCHVVGKAVQDRDEIADAIVASYREHLHECDGCRVLTHAHLEVVIERLRKI
ncbi:hypothetical protein ACFYQT_40925 [Streptomyces tibetensis]|uniref:Uncharacterized protein n=1 Tax=Streptomyces tibetensis TaxID=2382123 RepID=A0ABW6N940_9ACTN